MFAKLQIEEKIIQLSLKESTTGDKPQIDLSDLPNDLFIYDPGFVHTSNCESSITYIDPKKGELWYRGYPIEELTKKYDFLSIIKLILNGELPHESQYNEFKQEISNNFFIDESFIELFKSTKKSIHPMVLLQSMTSLLQGYEDLPTEYSKAISLISKIPFLTAYCYKIKKGEPINYPSLNKSYAENFLYMMFKSPYNDYKPAKESIDALDKIFSLHADHEQNASTAAVRLVGSTGSNIYSSVSAGIGALYGFKHGGANEACLNMLKTIGDVKNIDKYIAKAKDKDDSFKLMGFGHRVYKNYDPRAKILQKSCHEILSKNNSNNHLLDIAQKLEEIALNDEYFVSRNLYPNVDFYSGIILSALNIPTYMFTPIFALARTTGWCSQYLESGSSTCKIGRPRQSYIGKRKRKIEKKGFWFK